MKAEQIARYPDFLLEFESIAALAQWQRAAIVQLGVRTDSILNHLKLKIVTGGVWESMVYDVLKTKSAEDIKLLHRRFPVTTFEVLEKYMRIWLPEGKAIIEYDKEKLTFKVTIKKDTDTPMRRKLTRDILPCNMGLEFEAVLDFD